MKKWIPEDIDCTYCKWWQELKYPYHHKREECQFGNYCEKNCETCDLTVTKCKYLGYVEYGPFPLGDKCKICGEKNRIPKKYKISDLKYLYELKNKRAR